MYYKNPEHKYFYIQDSKELYCLLTGLPYSKIATIFYGRNIEKFVYRVRKLMKQLHVVNRRQLAYMAVKEHLVDLKRVKEYQNVANAY